jgi:hypothetical protein
MTAPAIDRDYHLVRFDDTSDAAAFVAALSRFLCSPVGSWYFEHADILEVWSSASALGSIELYLSGGALEAASAAFPPVLVDASCRGDALPEDSALMIGGERVSAWGLSDVEHFFTRR